MLNDIYLFFIFFKTAINNNRARALSTVFDECIITFFFFFFIVSGDRTPSKHASCAHPTPIFTRYLFGFSFLAQSPVKYHSAIIRIDPLLYRDYF